MAKPLLNYQTMSSELEAILLELQQGDLDVDLAMQRYERGLELIGLLEKYLVQAENKVAKLRLRAGGEDGA